MALVASTLAVAAPSAQAQPPDEPSLADKETARELFREGDEKYRAGDYEGALKAFAAADDIMGVPTTGVERARSLMKLGRLLEATEHLQRIVRIPSEPGENEVQKTARQEAATMLEEVRARIPSLRVEVKGSGGAEVSMVVDGVAIPPSAHDFPRKVDPGEHEIRVAAAGYQPEEESVQVDERQEKVVTIALTPLDDDTAVVDPWQSGPDPTDEEGGGNGYAIMMWTGFGFAAAGAIVGTVTGAMSIAKKDQLQDECGGVECPADKIQERDDALVVAHVSTASFVVAGVGAAIGTVGLILNLRSDDDDEAAATITPLIGPTSIGLRGTF